MDCLAQTGTLQYWTKWMQDSSKSMQAPLKIMDWEEVQNFQGFGMNQMDWHKTNLAVSTHGQLGQCAGLSRASHNLGGIYTHI
jgi:hypothetical protein